MLVLSRRLHEKIVLPDLGITLQVVAIKGGTVRIGIEAPPDVPILRGELLDQLKASAENGRHADKQLCCT